MQWIKTPRGLGMFLNRLSKSEAAKYLVKGKTGHRNTKIWTIKPRDGQKSNPW